MNATYPVSIYLFKIKNKNTPKRCEICSKITIKVPEDVPEAALVFILLT